jgi:uncharacterized phage protein (TIGR02216 family)
MTPRELAHAIRAVRGPAVAPLLRTEFDDLLARFPDAPRKGKHNG